MTTGHVLPGYGTPVTRLKRAQTAYPLDRKKLFEIAAKNVPTLEQRTLEEIRANARNVWLKPDRELTTYSFFHCGRKLDEPTESRPTSPTRRHKPHPKPVFLTNRLHYVPGYHNPDATMGKDMYRVDGIVPEEERQARLQLREKYIGRPSTAAVAQYFDPYEPYTEGAGPVEHWGAQAWMNIADDNYKHEVVNAVRDFRDGELYKTTATPPPTQRVGPSPRPHTAIPSMNRWLKIAGANESAMVKRSLTPHDYPPSTIQPLGNTMENTQSRRQRDVDNVKKSKYVHRTMRGEFLIHPEWPPNFEHHRLG